MTLFQRPPKKGFRKNELPWLLQGKWGERSFPPMSKVDLYGILHKELIASGLVSESSVGPSNKHHSEVTMTIIKSSWKNGRWTVD